MTAKEAYLQTIKRLEELKKEEIQNILHLINVESFKGNFSLLTNIQFKETLMDLSNTGYNITKIEFEFKNGQTIEEDRFKYRINWLQKE